MKESRAAALQAQAAVNISENVELLTQNYQQLDSRVTYLTGLVEELLARLPEPATKNGGESSAKQKAAT